MYIDELRKAAATIKERTGIEAYFIEADAKKQEDCEAAVAKQLSTLDDWIYWLTMQELQRHDRLTK